MNNEEKILIRENKILKLNNVLIRPISDNELIDINTITYMMESYIKSKGNTAMGPRISFSNFEFENEQAKVEVKLIIQLKNPIYNVSKPYEYQKLVRVSNCLFARFIGREECIQFAYQKLRVYAFENNIKLKGNSYTALVNTDGENIVADVFMQCMKDGDLIESV